MNKINDLPLLKYFTYPELIAMVPIADIEQSLAEDNLMQLNPGLYFRPKQSRFGIILPSTKENFDFIFDKFPNSFWGGHNKYGSWGITNGMANVDKIYTNSEELVTQYEFSLIELVLYPHVINPNFRDIYPFLELLNAECVFYSKRFYARGEEYFQEEVLQGHLRDKFNSFGPDAQVEMIRLALNSYPEIGYQKLQSLLAV